MRASVGSVILVRDHESPAFVERDVGWTRRDEEGSRAVLGRPIQPVLDEVRTESLSPPSAIDARWSRYQ